MVDLINIYIVLTHVSSPTLQDLQHHCLVNLLFLEVMTTRKLAF